MVTKKISIIIFLINVLIIGCQTKDITEINNYINKVCNIPEIKNDSIKLNFINDTLYLHLDFIYEYSNSEWERFISDALIYNLSGYSKQIFKKDNLEFITVEISYNGGETSANSYIYSYFSFDEVIKAFERNLVLKDFAIYILNNLSPSDFSFYDKTFNYFYERENLEIFNITFGEALFQLARNYNNEIKSDHPKIFKFLFELLQKINMGKRYKQIQFFYHYNTALSNF